MPERNLPTCYWCDEGKTATCVGIYDNTEIPRFACDDCCGHGCEDGQCWWLTNEDPSEEK